MVATVARIKLRSMWTNATDKAWKIVLEILGVLYAIGILVMMTVSVVLAVRDGALHQISTIGILIASAILIAWVVFPVFGMGMDSTLNPRSFAPYIAPSNKFSRALLWATPVGPGGIATLILLVLGTLSWFLDGRIVLGVLSILLIPVDLLVYTLVARVLSTSVSDYLNKNQKSRDVTGVVGTMLFLVVIFGFAFLSNAMPENDATNLYASMAKILVWTPLTGPAIIPNLIYAGQVIPLVLQIVYAVVIVGGLGWVWHRVVVKAMVGVPTTITPEIEQAIEEGRYLVDPTLVETRTEDASGLTPISDISKELRTIDLWSKLGLNPAAAALAARTARDWVKDARLLPSAIAVLMFPALGAVMMYAQFPGSEYTAIMMVALGPFIWGPTIGMLMSYDSTALWMQISAGVSGRTDRFARSLGSQIYVILFAIINGLVLAWVSDGAVPAFVGIVASYSLTLISSGLMFALTGRVAFGVQPPDASPLSTKGSGNQMLMILAMFGIIFLGITLMLPFVLAYLLIDQTAIVTTVLGLLLLVWGIAIHLGTLLWGGKLYDKYQAKILQQIASWPGH